MRLSIPRDPSELDAIPTGDAILGIRSQIGQMRLYARCLQSHGVIPDDPYTALSEHAAVKHFLAAAQERPDHAWVVAGEFTLGVALTTLILMDRALTEPLSQPVEPKSGDKLWRVQRRQDRHVRLQKHIGEATDALTYASGKNAFWPHRQDGYTRATPWLIRGEPHELESVAGPEMLMRWTRDASPLSPEQALAALRCWFEGGSMRAERFDDPRRTAHEAARIGDARTVMIAAIQAARTERLEQVRRLDAHIERTTFFPSPDDRRMSCIDLRGTPISIYEGSRIAFASSSANLVISHSEDGRTIRFSVWFFKADFNGKAFLDLVRKAEPGETGWNWVEDPDAGFSGVLSSHANPSALSPETILALMERCRT